MEIKRDWIPTYIVAIILIIVITAFTILYVQLNSRTAENNNTITSLTEYTTSLQSQLSSANSQVSSLTSQISTIESNLVADETKISQFNEALTSANSQISELSQQLNTANSKISTILNDTASLSNKNTTLQSLMTSLQNSLDSIQTQLTSSQSAITTLQSQVSTQQSTINALTTQINIPITLFSLLYVSETANTYKLVHSFTPTYTGYITISGTSSSSTTYILIRNNDTGISNTYNFGTSRTFYVQLAANDNYSIYLGNSIPSGTVTAILSATYQLWIP